MLSKKDSGDPKTQLVDDSIQDGIIETTDEIFGASVVGELPYLSLTESFFDMIINNTLSCAMRWDEGNQTCPLCYADESVVDTMKAKQWRSKSTLNDHIHGTFHSDYFIWTRRAKQRHAIENPKGPWRCPYCTTPRQFASLNNLVYHIKHSSAETEGADHQRMKEEDG